MLKQYRLGKVQIFLILHSMVLNGNIYDNSIIDENSKTISDYCIGKRRCNITCTMCIIFHIPDNYSYEFRLQRNTDIALKREKTLNNICNIRWNNYNNRRITYKGGLCYRTGRERFHYLVFNNFFDLYDLYIAEVSSIHRNIFRQNKIKLLEHSQLNKLGSTLPDISEIILLG